MKCPACSMPNRGGATQCKRCASPLPRTCAGCGDPIPEGVDLCINCRTERVPAALGAELDDDDLVEIQDDGGAPAFPIAPAFVGRKQLVERLAKIFEGVQSRKELAFVALRRFLAAASARRPLVLVLDDIQRASPETVNLCHYLSAGLASSPVAILVVGRPSLFETHPTFGEGDVTLERIELGPLSDDE